MKANKPVAYATPAQTDDLTRNVLIWLSAYKDIPFLVQPEPMLAAKQDGMELTVISHSITRRYITGGYQGEYQFGVIYRIVKPSGPDERLTALQDLNKLGNYAVTTPADLGENVRFLKCEVTDGARLYAPYDNGDEDYQILLKITYEVI